MDNQAQDELNKLIEKEGSKTAAARWLGVSPSLITEITKGRRNIPESVLKQLGFRRVVLHVREDRFSRIMQAIEKVV